MSLSLARELLLDMAQTARAAVHGRSSVIKYLDVNPVEGDIYIVAIGKAAGAMVEGALQQLSHQAESNIAGGLVISKWGHLNESFSYINGFDNFTLIESSHPSLALAVAQSIKDCEDIVFIAIGTDGSDGPGEDAGAIVDGKTCERGELNELDVADCLRRADAGTFLELSGDLMSTGPTGTNVMDLYIGIKS